MEVDVSGKTHRVKLYRPGRGLAMLSSGSTAEHEFLMSSRLQEAGIPTVPIIALGIRPGEALIVMEKISGWTDLQKILLDSERPFLEIRDRLQEYGQFARRLHDAGVWQHDFNPTNILAPLDPAAGNLKVIDFERMKLKKSISLRDRHRSLAKMNRIPELSSTDRMRFLRGYLKGGDERCGAVARSILDLFQVKISEDARKLARLCLREGRHFGEFYTETGKIYFRKGGKGASPRGLAEESVGDLVQNDWPGFERRRERKPLRKWRELHRIWTGYGGLPIAVEIDSSTGEGWLIFPG